MVIIGLGSGRCGTQTFAKMFGLPHEMYNPDHLKSDVSPYYLPHVEDINKKTEAKFVCLKRERSETVQSFVKNKILDKKTAEKYYDEYYKEAERLDGLLPNFKIFATSELNNPSRIEAFLGKKAKDISRQVGLCKLCYEIRNEPRILEAILRK